MFGVYVSDLLSVFQGEKKVATIQNVFAVIMGSEEPDRYVLLGNHRDAWTYGAVDPSSGTAALLDIARRFSALLGLGWKPRRTIILCSWDAEEFGMVCSSSFITTDMHCGSMNNMENGTFLWFLMFSILVNICL